MSDLRTLLHQAAPQPTATTAASVEQDLVRARRALRRRRASRLSASTGLVAAAAVGAFALVSGTSQPDPSGGDTIAAPRVGTPAVKLVAYTDEQPAGYTLDKVPAGWEVRDSTTGVLTLAPKGGAAEEPADGPTSFEGKIAVMTQNDTGVPTGVKLDDVTVGGQSAVIAHMLGSGDTRTLFARQASGTYLVIQVWDGLGWNNQQIAEFGSSVHITKDATPSFG